MGPVLKKPMVQVFITAFVDSTRGCPPHVVSILCPESAKPQLLTSQQFFQSVLEASGQIPLNAISCRICRYDVLQRGAALHVVVSEIGESSFEIGQGVAGPPKQTKGAVAFNLKRPKKPRKRTKPQKKAKLTGQAKPSGLEPHVQPSESESPESASEKPSETESSDSDSEAEAEKPLISASARQEQKETDALEKAQEEKAAEAEVASSSKEPQQPKVAYKTQCNPHLGVRGLSLQTANRLAECRHCFQPISKGNPRVAHAFSLVKFEAYVHFGCFADYLMSEKTGGVQGIDQAVDFLNKWLSAPQGPVDPEQVRKLIADLNGAVAKLKSQWRWRWNWWRPPVCKPSVQS